MFCPFIILLQKEGPVPPQGGGKGRRGRGRGWTAQVKTNCITYQLPVITIASSATAYLVVAKVFDNSMFDMSKQAIQYRPESYRSLYLGY